MGPENPGPVEVIFSVTEADVGPDGSDTTAGAVTPEGSPISSIRIGPGVLPEPVLRFTFTVKSTGFPGVTT